MYIFTLQFWDTGHFSKYTVSQISHIVPGEDSVEWQRHRCRNWAHTPLNFLAVCLSQTYIVLTSLWTGHSALCPPPPIPKVFTTPTNASTCWPLSAVVTLSVNYSIAKAVQGTRDNFVLSIAFASHYVRRGIWYMVRRGIWNIAREENGWQSRKLIMFLTKLFQRKSLYNFAVFAINPQGKADTHTPLQVRPIDAVLLSVYVGQLQCSTALQNSLCF